MTKNETISFIIPTYNNEKYIEECVQSVANQSYKDIEIIVIDDGSIDGTGKILDGLEKQIPNLRVFHNKNSGVSHSRNIGIHEATGQYIVFVDGDDYIASDFASYMLSLINTENADFAFSTDCFTSIKEGQNKKITTKILTPEDATALLLSPVVKVGCWDKIYRRSFLINNSIFFNEHLFYGEGLHFITDIAQKCNRVVVGNYKVYFYRRNNETSVCTTFDISKVYNGEKSLDRIENDLILHSASIDEMLCLHRCLFNAGALTKIRINKVLEKYKEDNSRWISYNKKHLVRIIKSHRISLYRKSIIFASCFFPGLLAILEKKRRERIQKNSV